VIKRPTSAKTWQDLAEALGLSEDTIKAAILSHELPGYRIGRKYVVPLAAFEDLIHGRWKPDPQPILGEPTPIRKAS